MRAKRLFWMGSHKILIPTELKALQDMGYETFHPPYLGKERDQSAVYDWACSPTTLPADVVAKLARYNFFWNTIDDEIAEILNTYFDSVMVTINGDWLLSFLKVFDGQIIYRTFGEPYSLSAHLTSNGARPLIENHPDFWFMPHCEENAAKEEDWLRIRERIVPYCLTEDVLSLANTWGQTGPTNGMIGLACPNVSNSYYNAHFRYLKSNFEERIYRYYGVQVDHFSDPNVVGTLSRSDQLAQFASLSGFLYTYREPNVCYLPPVEMITLGGPVLYLPGSLLDRYLGKNNVGRVADELAAGRAAKRLVAGDRHFAREIIDSQRSVATRYDSAYTLPVFRAAMAEMLPVETPGAPQGDGTGSRVLGPVKDRAPVLLLGHIPGAYSFAAGEYVSVHGIPRVMRRIVQVLTESGQQVAVTALPDAAKVTWGFYASQTSRRDLVKVVDFEQLIDSTKDSPSSSNASSYFRQVREGTINWIDGIVSPLALLRGGLIRLFSKKQKIRIAKKTGLDRFSYVIVPHYYLFPAINQFNWARILVYLPDYMPHFFRGRGWFAEDKNHEKIGRKLVNVAKLVMTNSEFSKNYLPDSELEVDASKIVAFPLPHLAHHGDGSVAPKVMKQLEDADYIFYPTQAHHNKRLDLLVKAWLRLRATYRGDWKLVLTCGVLPNELQQTVRDAGATADVILMTSVSDATLTWLYKNARCLAFTSEMEGNFPTQILEALELDCPIVTFDHPTINSELGEDAQLLETAPFADLDTLVDKIVYVGRFRNKVIRKQRLLLEKIGPKFSYAAYRENILMLDRMMTQN